MWQYRLLEILLFVYLFCAFFCLCSFESCSLGCEYICMCLSSNRLVRTKLENWKSWNYATKLRRLCVSFWKLDLRAVVGQQFVRFVLYNRYLLVCVCVCVGLCVCVRVHVRACVRVYVCVIHLRNMNSRMYVYLDIVPTGKLSGKTCVECNILKLKLLNLWRL